MPPPTHPHTKHRKAEGHPAGPMPAGTNRGPGETETRPPVAGCHTYLCGRSGRQGMLLPLQLSRSCRQRHTAAPLLRARPDQQHRLYHELEGHGRALSAAGVAYVTPPTQLTSQWGSCPPCLTRVCHRCIATGGTLSAGATAISGNSCEQHLSPTCLPACHPPLLQQQLAAVAACCGASASSSAPPIRRAVP